MPRKPTPAGKQRVRTGCLTCRKRRRKCDEQKPRCANCEVKGLACKYGADLAFVPPRSGDTGVGARQVYGTITFVDDSPAARAAAKERSQPPGDSASELRASSYAKSEISNPGDTTVYYDLPETRTAFNLDNILTQTGPVELNQRPSLFQHAPTSLNQPHRPFTQGTPHSYRGEVSSRTTTLSSINHETDLLRHFRYHISPWIDVGDPDCALGIQVLLLSRTNRPLQAATLALSASQRPLIAAPSHIEDFDSSIRFRGEAEDSLDLEPGLVGHAGRALLLVQDLLPLGPQLWRNILLPQLQSQGDLLHPAALEEELGEGIFWLHFRLDLAASILTSKQPIIPFQSYINRDGSPIQTPRPLRPRSINQVYKHSLCLLGHCLSLIYGGPDVSLPQAATPSDFAAFPALQQSHFLSQWTFLWSDCQKWYNERPVDTQQIVDVRGGEADKIDPNHVSALPILIYTTPMALVANAVYHITSLLLLGHKPRLLKSLPGPRCFTSHIWHAQSIAGIAASNESPEQWDPVLVSSLLLIARDMTHQSQQAVLMGIFHKITATTGMNLDRETEALQAGWKLARFDEDSDEMDM
ncbi:hypothetical protein PEBR_08372 [Penicillium brasilianum]|uniref:Zn(2)-C6 fungal-type domain-containing protein n=1 Tax=Penicillium brasilianum TaxID=104259 RepID=A0A1S9RWS0_PENBI|nr:hypothetical protein PEBR_08372 [Penicillium brasilianum]